MKTNGEFKTAEQIIRERLKHCIWGDEGNNNFMLDTVPAHCVIAAMEEYAEQQVKKSLKDNSALDLLEALQLITVQFETVVPRYSRDNEVLKTAKAAISKALSTTDKI